MCGVWMRTHFSRRVPMQDLIHPVKALSHRGPDGYGWWADDHVSLVHTRLSINDLAGGAQPLQSFDKKWIGIVNGELYDYKEIRQSLIDRGVHFATKSDSEVLLNLYALEGAQGLTAVSGEYSFIFYNTETKQVHFGRDMFGVKPLFFDSRGDSFTLASEMKALSDENPVFNPDYVNSFIARSIVPPQTCLKNVEHVWPGRVYTLDLKTKKVTWQVYQSIPLFQKRTIKSNEAIELLEFELKQAVKRRLVADVEIGCYLSGGIDSAMIAALAADLGAKPKAFTVGFADVDFDESRLANKIATDLGLEHHVVQMTSKNFMPSLIKSIVAFENPITNPHGAAKNLLASHTNKFVKVVLSGEGSDEWLGGYAYFRIKKLQEFSKKHPRLSERAIPLFLEKEMGMSLNHLEGDSTAFSSLGEKYFAGQSPALLGRLSQKRFYKYITGESLDPQIEKICIHLSGLLREENPDFKFSNWDLNSWMSVRTDLLHYILANVGDRQEMSHSIEGRTPFLDAKVVRAVGQMDTNVLLRGLTEKYALRKVGRKYLDQEHAKRGKKPFFAPMKYMYLRENRQLTMEYIGALKEQTPWLQWKNIEHFLFPKKRSFSSPLEDYRISLLLILFSLGALYKNLRVFDHPPRGYQWPSSSEDLKNHERIFT